jgi:hypothetical protein
MHVNSEEIQFPFSVPLLSKNAAMMALSPSQLRCVLGNRAMRDESPVEGELAFSTASNYHPMTQWLLYL